MNIDQIIAILLLLADCRMTISSYEQQIITLQGKVEELEGKLRESNVEL